MPAEGGRQPKSAAASAIPKRYTPVPCTPVPKSAAASAIPNTYTYTSASAIPKRCKLRHGNEIVMPAGGSR